MADALYAEIAAHFKIDAAGRMELWRERMEQDLPLMESVRTRNRLSSGVVAAQPRVDHLNVDDAEGVPGATSTGPTAAMELSCVPHSWDRKEGESCTSRVEQALANIESHAHLNAFTAVFARQALAQAQFLDEKLSRGENIGPFGGAIVAIKDIMGVQGSRISGATAAYQAAPAGDALVVARLRAAGGIIIGTANLHALAYGPFSTSSDFGAVRNPLNTAHVAGGSSGGSAAAVAAGLADVAVGTDTAGSIRMPAALCGLVGVKPTYSWVPRDGAQSLAASLDHIGPLARTVADAKTALYVMAGIRENHSTGVRMGHLERRQLPLAGISIGLADTYVDELLTPPIRQAFKEAKELVQVLGATLTSVHLPTLETAPGIMLCTLGPEAFHTFHELLRHRADMLPEDVRLRLEAGMFITAEEYERSQLLRDDLRQEIDLAFHAVDALMTPTMAVTAPLLSEADGSLERAGGGPFRIAMNPLTLPFNLSGHPSLTLPFCFDDNGAGVGIQLIGARHADSALLEIASILEASISSASRVHRS